jgi:hypothetical protein
MTTWPFWIAICGLGQSAKMLYRVVFITHDVKILLLNLGNSMQPCSCVSQERAKGKKTFREGADVTAAVIRQISQTL